MVKKKPLLARGMITLVINGRRAVINSLRKFGSLLSWLVIFAVVSFNKIPLVSKDF